MFIRGDRRLLGIVLFMIREEKDSIINRCRSVVVLLDQTAAYRTWSSSSSSDSLIRFSRRSSRRPLMTTARLKSSCCHSCREVCGRSSYSSSSWSWSSLLICHIGDWAIRAVQTKWGIKEGTLLQPLMVMVVVQRLRTEIDWMREERGARREDWHRSSSASSSFTRARSACMHRPTDHV